MRELVSRALVDEAVSCVPRVREIHRCALRRVVMSLCVRVVHAFSVGVGVCVLLCLCCCVSVVFVVVLCCCCVSVLCCVMRAVVLVFCAML